MSAHLVGLARWSAGLALALGLHGAAAFFMLTRWHADAGEIASAPAILVDFAPAPAAPAVKPTELPPGPPQPQQQAQQQQQQAVAKVAAKAPPAKPVKRTIEVPPAPQPTVAVLPPPRPREKTESRKPRHRLASLASAPSSAERRAARAAAKAPGAAAQDPNALPNWRSALVAVIERHKHYPAQALARGEQGVAQVAFSVDRRGGLHDARIVRSSGSSVLDRDALAWLRRAEPLPPPPPEIRGARISVTVPLRYDIR
jgi:periplasmic protein TonB